MIRVKFLASGIDGRGYAAWRRQLPDAECRIGNCEFILDVDCSDYDWLVVYNRFPKPGKGHGLFGCWVEELACSEKNTIFITSEPSSVNVYCPAFLNQFGYVLTGQEPWAIDHPGTIRRQPGLRWFYGSNVEDGIMVAYDALKASKEITKTSDLSAVCSTKSYGHTLHRRRLEFVYELGQALPEMKLFGRGIQPVKDKADAIDLFKYHIVIENHSCPNHWTEKLADCFLGWSMPFYYGCSNLADYFPEESYCNIDIFDLDKSVEIIRSAISSNRYENSLHAIREARRRVLEEYNIFSELSRFISGEGSPREAAKEGQGRRVIYGRQALRLCKPWTMLSHAARRVQVSRELKRDSP